MSEGEGKFTAKWKGWQLKLKIHLTCFNENYPPLYAKVDTSVNTMKNEKGGRKLAVKPWKNVAINRMTNVKHNIFVWLLLLYVTVQWELRQKLGLGSRLTPDFCDEKSLGARLRWHDPDTEKIRTFCDFDCRDKKRHNRKLCDIRMKCNVVIHIQNPMLRTE